MIVCVCKAVSDKHIQAAIDNGAVSLGQIVQELGVGTCCGSCVPHVEETLAACNAGRRRTLKGASQLTESA
jgi:bacterioferritin-associated ferredoxin